jgi:hypothetical protein
VRFSSIGARTPEKQQTSDLQKKILLSEGQRNIEFLTVSRLGFFYFLLFIKSILGCLFSGSNEKNNFLLKIIWGYKKKLGNKNKRTVKVAKAEYYYFLLNSYSSRSCIIFLQLFRYVS